MSVDSILSKEITSSNKFMLRKVRILLREQFIIIDFQKISSRLILIY